MSMTSTDVLDPSHRLPFFLAAAVICRYGRNGACAPAAPPLRRPATSSGRWPLFSGQNGGPAR